MFWYIFWFLAIEAGLFVVIFASLLLIIEVSARSGNLNRSEYIRLIQPIKLSLWALISILTFNLSFVLHRDWRVVLIYELIALFVTSIGIILRFLLMRRNLKELMKYDKVLYHFCKRYVSMLLVGLFLFIVLIVLRSFTPDLISTEKPMDFSFIQSFVRQKFIPFENPWLAHVVLNYYYLGQFWVSILAVLSPFSVAVVYNLAVSLIAVYAFQLLIEFFLVNLKSGWWLSIIFPSVILFGGNIGFLVKIIQDIFNTHYRFFYPDPTRIIPHTINEYPAYSILLADLHGHYIMLPFVYASAILIYVIFRYLFTKAFEVFKLSTKALRSNSTKTKGLNNAGIPSQKTFVLVSLVSLVFLVPFILGGNSWDIINLLFLSFILLGLISAFFINLDKKLFFIHNKQVIIGIFLAAVLIFFNSLPFLYIYITPGGGIGWHPINDLPYYLLTWGHVFIYLYILLLLILIYPRLYHKLYNPWKHDENVSFVVKFILNIGFILAGLLEVLLTQFFYVKDVFHIVNKDYFRANTVFKIYYTSWFFMLFGIFSMFVLLFQELKKYKNVIYRPAVNRLVNIMLVFSFLLLGYFVVGISQRFLGFPWYKIPDNSKYILNANALDGLVHKNAWFDKKDLQVLAYLKSLDYYRNLIIEPLDYNAYSNTAKYCIYAGGQCFMGWPLHNMQWYGGWIGKGLKYSTSINRKTDKINVDIRALYIMNNAAYKINEYYLEANENNIYSLLSKNRALVKNFHFLFYSKDNMITDPFSSSMKFMRYLRAMKICSNVHMIHIGHVYDIICN